jgi:hypothetical protein
MAERASADRVAADMRPPDYRAAIKRIRSAIIAKQTRIASINGEISDEWSKVESNRVNKKAARIFLSLDKLEGEERADIVRSLNGLIAASGWDLDATDLVDKAQGSVVPLHVGPRVGDEGQGDSQGDDEDEGEGDEHEADGEAEMQSLEAAIEAEEKPASRKSRRTKADQAQVTTDVARRADARREQMRSKLSVVPPAHEGDNTDLAGE